MTIPGIRLAARCFHRLTDEEAEQRFLAGLELGHLVGIRGEHLGDLGLDRAGVADLLQPALLDDPVGAVAGVEHDLEDVFRHAAGQRSIRLEREQRRAVRGRDRAVGDALAGGVERPEQIGDHPVRSRARNVFGFLALLERCFLKKQLEPRGGLLLRRQHRCVVLADAELADIAFALGVGKLRQVGPARRDERIVEFKRQEVGVGKIAIVVRILLRTERPRLHAVGIEQPCFLTDRATSPRESRPGAPPRTRSPP